LHEIQRIVERFEINIQVLRWVSNKTLNLIIMGDDV